MKTDRFVFLGANTPWVYELCCALATRGHDVTAIAAYDWMNFRRLRPRWPEGSVPALLRRNRWVLPPGYVGIFSSLFGPVLRKRLNKSAAKVKASGTPWVVSTYPWFNRALRDVPDSRLIYYNLDNYALYHPARAALIRRQEEELINRAALTLCLSQRQVDVLRARFPEKKNMIRHFPLGVAETYLNPHPESAPASRSVGYVGNLIDRVDWRFVKETAQAIPDVEFTFVGGLEDCGQGGHRPHWREERETALTMPNVKHVDKIDQHQVSKYYWQFAANWIPYATDHPFNEACCPTKIMDGLASGRPVLSTAIPECLLYPEWIAVSRSTEEVSREIKNIIDCQDRETAHPRPSQQVEFARRNTWTERATTLVSWLPET